MFVALAAIVAGAAGAPAARASGPDAMRDLAGCEANTLPRNDDSSTDRISLPFSMKFFGRTHTSLFVNNNGNVTFDSAQWEYTPYPLEDAVQPIIAPFFADVDTRSPDSGVVTYGMTTVKTRPAFCVNWSGVAGVGYYAERTDKLNKFQLLLIDRSDVQAGDFDIELNFDQIQWETGEASSGDDGLGGDSARVGYSAGDQADSYELPGSGLNGVLLDSSPAGLIHRSRGTTQLGRFLFAVDDGVVLDRGRPLPKLIFLAGIGGNEIRKSDCTFLCAVWPQILVAARYGSDLEVEPDGETPSHPTEGGEVFDSVFTSEVYRTALNTFRSWACEFGNPCDRVLRDFDTFKYDWRIGERTEGLRFADRLEQECEEGPLWLVVHSTGGIVLKSAFHRLRDRGTLPKNCLDGGGVFFLATPHLGAPKAVGSSVNTYNFFGAKQRDKIGSDSLRGLTRDVNNWLTVWQLMPRAGIESDLEAFPWYLQPAAGKKPREAWFSDGRRNANTEALNFALDDKADQHVPYHQPLGPTIGQVQYYNVIGYGGITAGSYAPETCEVVNRVARFTPSSTDARVDGVIVGDGTVPTWSSSWPGQLLDSQHLYAIPRVPHGQIPNDPDVLALIKRVITSGDAELYPDWRYAHGDAAVRAAHPTSRPQFVRATWCSPVAGRAIVDGQITGVGDDGTVYEQIPGSLVDLEGSFDDPQTSVFVLAGPDESVPVFETRATGSGPVGFVFTDEDEVDHGFEFDVQPGDTSRFVKQDGVWRLLVDRGGDGSTEQAVDLGAPSVDFTAESPLTQGHSETLTARLGGEEAVGDLTYTWSISGAAGSLVPNGSSATLKAVHAPGTVTVTVKVTTGSGAVATYSNDVAIEFAPPYTPAGVACEGDPGHVVLAPLNSDGSSVFRAGSTVPVKFRVCDAQGASVSDPAVVTSFALTKTTAGTVVTYVNEAPVSTAADSAFRWDPTARQWIFNLSTRSLTAGKTYTYLIELNDGSGIEFAFGLR